MRTIETTAVVTANRVMTVQLPPDVPVGTHRVVVVVDAGGPAAEPRPPRWADWPAHDVALADPTCTFRREDLYGDDGR